MRALESLEFSDRIGILAGFHIDEAVAIDTRARLRAVARSRQFLVERRLPSGHRRHRRCRRRRLALIFALGRSFAFSRSFAFVWRYRGALRRTGAATGSG